MGTEALKYPLRIIHGMGFRDGKHIIKGIFSICAYITDESWCCK